MSKQYVASDYPVELVEDTEQKGFFAHFPDLPGCGAQGRTPNEAIRNAREAFSEWINVRLESGLQIPEPLPQEPSGRFLVRTTAWLHGSLMSLAQRQGVSLNLLVNNVLSEFLGGAAYRHAVSRLERAVEQVEGLSLFQSSPSNDAPRPLAALGRSDMQAQWSRQPGAGSIQ